MTFIIRDSFMTLQKYNGQKSDATIKESPSTYAVTIMFPLILTDIHQIQCRLLFEHKK
jgi:hypothetical protein